MVHLLLQQKHTCLIGMLLLFCCITFNETQAQYNLVPNSSFEQYTQCPSAATLSEYLGSKPDAWYKPDKRGAGYYNACAGNNVVLGVPSHPNTGGDGFQYARTGVGYIGMFYYNSGSHNYFQIQLKDSLKAGHCYYGECYVSLSNPFKVACNNQGILLTNQAIYVDTANGIKVLPANSQIINYGNQVIKDTLNWVKVSSFFTAQGGEQYLTLGNFKDDNNTSFKVVNPTGGYYGAAYYVDDVSVIPLDSFPLRADAGPDTTIALGDSVFIGSLTNGIPNITWYNSSGAVIDTGRPGFFVHPTISTSYIIEQTVCGYYSRDTVTVTVNVMPLHWLGFTAAQLSSSRSDLTPDPSPMGEGRKTALLRWQTANEQNVSHINIQRSFRGTNEFENVGQVAAKNKPYNEYSFVDELTRNEKRETALYRLQSMDKDGYRSYSPVRRVVFNIKPSTLNIFPNPAKIMVNIAYAMMKEVTITDIAGRVVLSKTMSGINNLQIDVSHLPKGLYIVKVTNTDNVTETQKLVIE